MRKMGTLPPFLLRENHIRNVVPFFGFFGGWNQCKSNWVQAVLVENERIRLSLQQQLYNFFLLSLRSDASTFMKSKS